MARNRKIRVAKKKKTWIWALLLSLFVVEFLFYTWCRVQSTNTGYDIARATRRYEDLLALQQNLHTEIASLKAPERIKEIAVKQLGLVMPTPD